MQHLLQPLRCARFWSWGNSWPSVGLAQGVRSLQQKRAHDEGAKFHHLDLRAGRAGVLTEPSLQRWVGWNLEGVGEFKGRERGKSL